jgi:hypothetical protein|tara:strand:- start:2104 stop:2529 length:426 start_codon:yes stop_codon:yes gene_type:complete
MKEANQIAEYLTDISEVDVFANCRKRANVEVRSLLTFILRNQFNMNYHEIKRFYESNDKNYDHTTAIYSYKNFGTYRKYNPKLNKYLDLVLLQLKDKAKLHRALINHIIDYTLERDLKKVLKLVDSLPNGNKQTKEKMQKM